MDCVRDPLPTAALTVLVLAALVIPGSHAWSGPVLLVLTPTHGVHLTDLAVVAVGLVVLLEAGRRWRDGALVPRLRRQGRVALPSTAAAGRATRSSSVAYDAVARTT